MRYDQYGHPVLETQYMRPDEWKYRYAARPYNTTVLMARVRVWLEDPVTGLPTGMTLDELLARLALCSRIENYSITKNVKFEDEPEGVYGYWDYQDEDAWAKTPGRNPYIDDEDFEMYCGNYMHDYLDLRIAFKKQCKPVTADFLKRLVGCKLRDIAIVDRANTKNISEIPYAEQVRLWLDGLDTDTDFENQIMLHDIYGRDEETDSVTATQSPETAGLKLAFNEELTPVITQMSYADRLAEKRMNQELEKTPPTLLPGGDPSAPEIRGCGIFTDEGKFLPFMNISPYELSLDELIRATGAQTENVATLFIDPQRCVDRSLNDVPEEGLVKYHPALVRSFQTEHVGWCDYAMDGSHPRHYHFDSGNGLKYDIWGRYALVEDMRPDAEAMQMIESDAGLKWWFENAQKWRTCLPLDVFVSAFAWAFHDVEVNCYKPQTGWLKKLVDAGAEFPELSSYAVAWYVYHTEKLGYSHDDMVLNPHPGLRRKSALTVTHMDRPLEGFEVEYITLVHNLNHLDSWDAEHDLMFEHPLHEFGSNLEYEAHMDKEFGYMSFIRACQSQMH